MDAEHDIFAGVFDSCKYGAHHSWNDTLQFDIFDVRALHCMRLSRRSLTIGENGSVEAIQDTLDDRLGSQIIHLLLAGFHVEHSDECEIRVLFRHQILPGLIK